MARADLSFPREKIKILLLEGIHDSAIESFKSAGYTSVERLPYALSGNELSDAIKDAHIVGIRSRTKLTADVINQAPHLLAVGCFCIGTDQVDLSAAKLAGVPVFNAPFSNTRSVAELTLAHIVYLLRGISAKNIAAHEGRWLKSAENSYEARGKRLGIIGYGRIGTQVGVLAEALGMEVCFYDPVNKLPIGNNQPVSNLNELLKQSDVVSLHVPDTTSTRQLIGSAEIALMKPGVKLINLSRGHVLDIDAVAGALKNGQLGGVAVDVFPEEPSSSSEKFKSKLQQFDNAILTPHIGGSTMEAQSNIGVEVAQKLIKYSDDGSTTMAVNFPEVDLPTQKDVHRLLHIHRNQPGVMSDLSELLAGRSINISAQYLATDPEIGYVVTDVDVSERQLNPKELDTIPGTIKTRVLY